MKKAFYKPSLILFALAIIVLANVNSGCGIYKLTESEPLPDSIKTFRVVTMLNSAPYQNPQLAPNLSEKLRQKIGGQTKLIATNNDNAHYDISGTITDYSPSTTGVSNTNGQTQASLNRLTVSVHIVVNKTLSNEKEEFDISRSFDFNANRSLQSVESELLPEIVRNLSDEIFNRLFSKW
ncbi:MAG: LPS assembly lipoprotein LptE [Candidatus Dadabacteria bacterium]